MSPIKTKKLKILLSVCILLSLLLFAISTVYLNVGQYNEKLLYGDIKCIDGIFILPQSYAISGNFDFNHKFYSEDIYSKEFCFRTNEFLEENKKYEITLKPFNFKPLSKTLSFVGDKYPNIQKQSKTIGAKGSADFKLEKDISSVQYHILNKNDGRVQCNSKGRKISCAIEELNLEQGKEQKMQITKRNSLQQEEVLKEFNIKTYPELEVVDSKVFNKDTYKPKLEIVFSGDVQEIGGITLKQNGVERSDLDIDFEKDIVHIQPKFKLKHSHEYTATIKEVVGDNKSFLEDKKKINFTTKPAPNFWWIYPDNIQIANIEDKEHLTLVNKERQLPKKYEPQDLVEASKSGLQTKDNIRLRNILIRDLKHLGTAAKKDGINLKIVSGYRCYETQERSYQNAISKNDGNISLAKRVSAKPGHSEHQLGTAIDFGTKKAAEFQSFNTTRAAKWLEENAWEYGFVKSYPERAEHITGYIHEGWHYRYLGKEKAKDLQNSGLVLQQWLEYKTE